MSRPKGTMFVSVLVGLAVIAPAVHPQREPLHGLDAYIRKSMAEWQIPGLAIAVVKDDNVVFLRGYGTRQVDRNAPVDEHTLFPLASTTKAFTAFAVAMLVDEGKLSWDDPVSKHLPWLEFADAWVTRTVTVRDLLTHRVAGGWGGSTYPLIFLTSFKHDEILRRMRYLGGSGSGFRSRFSYDNANYWAAGALVAAVSGMPWPDFVRTRIFKPLEMVSARASVYDLWDERAILPCFECGLEGHTVSLEDARVKNIAVFHRLGDAGLETAPAWPLDNDPSGAIYADIEDVAKWLRLQLGKGAYEGKRLLTPAVFEEMHAPQVVVDGPQADVGPGSGNFWAYGFAWYMTDYRGRKAVMHGGGFMCYMAMLPEEGLGVAVLANLPSQLRQALIFRIFDAYLGAPERDWSAEMLEKTRVQRERRRAAVEKRAPEQAPGRTPSIPLAGYVGSYTHPAFGMITVTEENARLVLRFVGGQIGDLEHWQGDKFRVNWRGPDRYRTFASFTTTPQMPAIAVHLEFPGAEFTRVPEPDK